jgi:hypothetical protein
MCKTGASGVSNQSRRFLKRLVPWSYDHPSYRMCLKRVQRDEFTDLTPSPTAQSSITLCLFLLYHRSLSIFLCHLSKDIFMQFMKVKTGAGLGGYCMIVVGSLPVSAAAESYARNDIAQIVSKSTLMLCRCEREALHHLPRVLD